MTDFNLSVLETFLDTIKNNIVLVLAILLLLTLLLIITYSMIIEVIFLLKTKPSRCLQFHSTALTVCLWPTEPYYFIGQVKTILIYVLNKGERFLKFW